MKVRLDKERLDRWAGSCPGPANRQFVTDPQPAQAMSENENPAESDGRVVPLRRAPARADKAAQSGTGADMRADTLAGFGGGGGEDDYRHRMITNVAGLAVLALLILGGIWIADTMASIKKNQDCVLSGQRGCTPVDAPPPRRW